MFSPKLQSFSKCCVTQIELWQKWLRSAQSFCGDLNFHSPHYILSQSALVRSYLYLQTNSQQWTNNHHRRKLASESKVSLVVWVYEGSRSCGWSGWVYYIEIAQENVVWVLCDKEHEAKDSINKLGESAERFPTRVANQTKQREETSCETHMVGV